MEKKLLQIFAVLAVMLFLAAPLCARPWGIVSTQADYYADNESDNASIHVIDLGEVPPVVYGPFFSGQLTANRYDSVLDIAMVPGNRKALISTFYNSMVHVVGLSDPTNPVLERSFTLPFYAEDIAISNNKKLALVTDGGSTSLVAIIDLQKITAATFDIGPGRFAQAVAVGRNNVAIFADFSNGTIHYGKINKAKNGLESIGTIALCDEGQYDNATNCEGPVGNPVNVAISPDGKTALVAPGWGGAVFVLEIKGNGTVVPGDPFILTGLPGGELDMYSSTGGQQSIAFQNSKTAYVLSHRWELPGDPDEAVTQPMQAGSPNADGLRPDQLSQINIKGPGRAEFVAARYTLLNSCASLLFGVDTLDIYKNTALVGNDTTDSYGIGTPYENPYYNNVVFIDLKTGILTPIELNNYGIGTGVAIKP
jgi:hypothetical protein